MCTGAVVGKWKEFLHQKRYINRLYPDSAPGINLTNFQFLKLVFKIDLAVKIVTILHTFSPLQK